MAIRSALLIALVTLAIFALASCTSEADGAGQAEPDTEPIVFEASLAQCLTDSGVAMYGADTCPACRQQKTLFGESFVNVTYVECDKSDACQREGIRSIPTWIRGDGEQLVGVRSLDALAQWAGCEAPV